MPSLTPPLLSIASTLSELKWAITSLKKYHEEQSARSKGGRLASLAQCMRAIGTICQVGVLSLEAIHFLVGTTMVLLEHLTLILCEICFRFSSLQEAHAKTLPVTLLVAFRRQQL